MDARRVLQLLEDEEKAPAAVGEALGASREAVDEARCLLEEIASAEVDAILAMPPPLARGLLRAAGEAGRHDVLQDAVLHGSKELQKEAKRVAHHLRVQGREVALPAKPPPAPAPAPPAEPELPVFLSVADPAGQRLLVWSRPLAGRGVEVAEIVASDQGVVYLRLGDMPRKKLRELARGLPQGQAPVVALPREEVRRVLDRVRHAIRAGGRCPPEFPSWALQAVGPLPEAPPAPLRPVGEGIPPDDPAARASLAADSGALFDEVELMGWLPDEGLLRQIALRVDEARSSPLYLPGQQGEAQREEAVEAAIEREIGRFFDQAQRAAFATRLLEAARLLEAGGKVEQARVAAATAIRLEEGAPTQEVPFCAAYVRRVLEPPAGGPAAT
jgi:hypothetical protein